MTGLEGGMGVALSRGGRWGGLGFGLGGFKA